MPHIDFSCKFPSIVQVVTPPRRRPLMKNVSSSGQPTPPSSDRVLRRSARLRVRHVDEEESSDDDDSADDPGYGVPYGETGLSSDEEDDDDAGITERFHVHGRPPKRGRSS